MFKATYYIPSRIDKGVPISGSMKTVSPPYLHKVSFPSLFPSHLFTRLQRHNDMTICHTSLTYRTNSVSYCIYIMSHRAHHSDNSTSGVNSPTHNVDSCSTAAIKTSKVQRNVKRILLVRNGQSDANVNLEFYCKVPDWKIGITSSGVEQMRRCGRRIAMLTNGDPIYIYFSPYARSVESMKAMLMGGLEGRNSKYYYPDNGFSEKISSGITGGSVIRPLNIIGLREDARLRDGDIGRYNSLEELSNCLMEREEYGKFFYRFPNGESPADVYDRISSFMDAFQREQTEFPPDTTVVILTHGLTIRTFVKKWFNLNVDTFHNMISPPPGSTVELFCVPHDNVKDPQATYPKYPQRFKLSEQSIKRLNLPSSLSEDNGYAFRNKRALGSISTGAPFV